MFRHGRKSATVRSCKYLTGRRRRPPGWRTVLPLADSAFLAVRALLRYIQNHDFTLFAWYRIVFGVLILILA